MKNDLVATVVAARERREFFLRRIEQVSAVYIEGGEDYDGFVTPGFYAFNLLRYFSQKELDELFTIGCNDLVVELYNKVMATASYCSDWLYEFDRYLAVKMVEIWDETHLRQEICDKFASLSYYSAYSMHLTNFEMAIVQTGKHDLIMLLIDKSFKKGLSDVAQKSIFARQNEEEIFYLMHQYNLNNRPLHECDELAVFQIKTLKVSDEKKQHRLIEMYKLMNSAQIFMYKHLPKEFYYMHLDKYGVCQELQMIALQNPDKKMFKEITAKHHLAEYGASDYFVEHCTDEEFFNYPYNLDDGAEILLLKQGNMLRILHYVKKHGLKYRALDYALDSKMADVLSSLVEKEALKGGNLKKYIEFASPDDIANNLKAISPDYCHQYEIDLCFETFIQKGSYMLIAECLYAKHCSKEVAKKLWAIGDEEICRSLVMNMYCDEYETFVFKNSDIDMIKEWCRSIRYRAKNVPEYAEFTHFDEDIIRFLTDNCIFSANTEKRFLEQRSEKEGLYYMEKFYPYLKH